MMASNPCGWNGDYPANHRNIHVPQDSYEVALATARDRVQLHGTT
jgi:hypothetical protein